MNPIYRSLVQAGLILITLPIASIAAEVDAAPPAVDAVATAPVAPTPAQPGEVGLQQVIEKVVTNNPEVQSRYHAFKAAEFEQSAARGGFFPKVDITATGRAQEKLITNVNQTAVPNFQTQLILRQMLFDGFATSAEVKRLGSTARVRYYELQSSMQNLTLETVKTYIDLLRYRQFVKYAQDNYAAHKQIFDRIQERTSSGVGRKVDLEQANGRLALAEASLLEATTSLHDAMAKYQRLVGEVPAATLAEPSYYQAGVAESSLKALQITYQKNPDLLAAIENIEASKHEVDTRKSKYLPRADLQGTANLAVSSNGENSTNAADNAQLVVSMNLFNGLSDKAAINQSEERLNGSADLKDKVCLDTRQQLALAYNDTLQLKSQLAYRDQHQLSIEKAREAYRKQYDIGQRTLLDLLDTENEYFQARKAYTNTERDLQAAFARTYAVQGDLLNKVSVTRNDLPDVQGESTDGVCNGAELPVPLEIDKASLVPPREVAVLPLPKPVPLDDSNLKAVESKTLPSVQFEVNSSVIKTSAFNELDATLSILKEWTLDSKVEVAGHTDKRNTSKNAYNMNLSQRRAEAVRQYFISKGINASRLKAVGYGYTKPVAPNDPINGSDLNRRVEIIRYK